MGLLLKQSQGFSYLYKLLHKEIGADISRTILLVEEARRELLTFSSPVVLEGVTNYLFSPNITIYDPQHQRSEQQITLVSETVVP